MNNEQSSMWENIIMFFSALFGVLNLRATIKGVQLGMEIERLKRENITLKRRITQLEHDRTGIS